MDVKPADALVDSVASYQLQAQDKGRRSHPAVYLVNLLGQAMPIAARTTTKLGAAREERLAGLDDLEVSK